MAIAIRSHNNRSESLINWRALFNEATGGRNAIILRPSGSRFRLREADWVLNWGSSVALPSNIRDVAPSRLINSPMAVGLATNKINCLTRLQQNNIPTVEFSTDMDYVFNNSRDAIWYERRVLQGHSGEGIAIVSRGELENTGNIPVVGNPTRQGRLWTKAITGPRREFRIHVFNGVITNVQLKRRRSGYRDMPEYSEVVRNFHTGWVYTTSNINPNEAALTAAVNSVNALGLTFGAVDVITNRDDAWVLEVNTAPGMEGSNAECFVNALINYTNDRPITPWNVNDAITIDSTNEDASETDVAPEPTTTAEQAQADFAQAIQPFDFEGLSLTRGIQRGELNVIGLGTQPAPIRAAREETPPAPVNPFASPTQAAITAGLVNGGIYVIRLDNTEQYGQYDNNAFYLFGFSIRIPVSRVEVVRHVV